MTCRRKTKSERELVADIHKTFTVFCKDQCCRDCEKHCAYRCGRKYDKK